MAKPSNPKGTRDFLPFQMAKRSYIFDLIAKTFVKYGYQNIETPAMENMETLTGKYGEEGDRLIFKILKSGDYSAKADFSAPLNEITSKISSSALRYDLTVPFARFVSQHRDKITFPFKRYQIQPVWRADRPQKSRYREFFQCDADVVGSESLINEVEQIQILDEVFTTLNIKSTIHVNNRKILQGISELIGQPDKLIDMTVSLDKLDKIGVDGVITEMEKRGINNESINKIKPLFDIKGSWQEKLGPIKEYLASSEIGLKGIEELEYVLSTATKIGIESAQLNFNLTLARGLDYYTGAIFEVTTDMVQIGSISGGGRYDDLTSLFGLPNVSGVGISFGADRIYDVMEEANLWPSELELGVEVLFVNFGDEEMQRCLAFSKKIRANGISAEVYPESVKMKKQMKYANDKNIQRVVIIGSDEMKNQIAVVKDMKTGEEQNIDFAGLVNFFQ